MLSFCTMMHSSPLRTAANKRRKQINGNQEVTYLIDRNINYTNVVLSTVSSVLLQAPGHEETYTQTVEQISARIDELEEIGGVRILMQGGVNPELGIDYYTDLIHELRNRHPTIDLDCFSPIEIEGIAEDTGLTTLQVLEHLQKAGMHGLPGGGSEMLVDNIWNEVSPKKGSPDNWLRVMSEAQSLGMTTSATNVFGFGESNADRVEHMRRIRDLQDESIAKFGGFTSFIVASSTKQYIRKEKSSKIDSNVAGPSEYLRHVAISRLFFDNIERIQASWPTMGLSVAKWHCLVVQTMQDQQ